VKRYFPYILFLVLWGFHLYSAGGTLVPYRDTGEMVVNAHTLGVAHPPGYPFYTLTGKMADMLPVGNPAYRLNALSALASALAGVGIYFLLAGPICLGPAVIGVGLWATSPVFWELSSVSEMYTLALLAMVFLFVLVQRLADTPRLSLWLLLSFGVGLASGIRTDVILLFPALLFFFWSQREHWGGTGRGSVRWGFLMAMGFFFFFRGFRLPLSSHSFRATAVGGLEQSRNPIEFFSYSPPKNPWGHPGPPFKILRRRGKFCG